MKPYKAYFTVWQISFAILVFGLVWILTGCNIHKKMDSQPFEQKIPIAVRPLKQADLQQR